MYILDVNNKRWPAVKGKCKNCGVTFVSISKLKKFCSDMCQYKRRKTKLLVK